MGLRLSKIYTRTGDDGTTGVGGGLRLFKDSDLIAAIGDVDELNAVIGCVLAESVNTDCRAILTAVQHHLFDVGGELAYPEYHGVQDQQVVWLESWIDFLNQRLEPLQEFILPQGSRAVTFAHLARTVCRRAERAIVRCSKQSKVRTDVISYINRLSDLLFVLSRILQESDVSEPAQWNKHFVLPQPGTVNANRD